MSVPQTPTRRSQRFQPTATPSSKVSDKNILQCEWAGNPIFTRQCNAELDLLPEEREEKAEKEDEDDEEEIETLFYESFKMKRKATNYRGAKQMKLAKAELHTYRVGDTVMVETDTLYLMKKPPSIGVIVAMWETRRKGVENHEGATAMRVRIHWFLRPTELASIRAKREHEKASHGSFVYLIASTNICHPIERNLLLLVDKGRLDPQRHSFEMFRIFVTDGKGRRKIIPCYSFKAKRSLPS